MDDLLKVAAKMTADVLQMPGLGQLGSLTLPSAVSGLDSLMDKMKSDLEDSDDEGKPDPGAGDLLNAVPVGFRNSQGAEGVKKELKNLLESMNSTLFNLTNKDHTTELMEKIEKGDVQAVKALIDDGVDVNVRSGAKKMTPLILACTKKSTKIVQLLLDNEAEINHADLDGDTALILALTHMKEEVAGMLIARGAKIEAKDLHGKNALHIAALKRCNSIIAKLIEKGADIDSKDLRHWTALMLCCQYDCFGTVNLLIKNGADIEAQQVSGGTALNVASGHGHTANVKALIKAKANTCHADNNGITPLIMASMNGHYLVARKLAKHGAKVNHCDKVGRSALFYSCLHGREDVAEFLLSSEGGADPNMCDNEENTPLMSACQEGKLNIAKCLLENGADKFIVNNGGMTALSFAVQGGHTPLVRLLLHHEKESIPPKFLERPRKLPPLLRACAEDDNEMIELLINAGANASIMDKEGRVPLIICAMKGNSNAITQLIHAGADVNASDKNGITPLHGAVSSGIVDAVEVLLSNDAKVNQIDSNGRTPLMKAAHENYLKIVKVLLSKGANLNAQDVKGWSALMFAAQFGYSNVVGRLLEAEALPDLLSINGANALHIASANGHIDVSEILLAAEVSVNAADEDGGMALHRAAKEGLKDLAQLLIEQGADIDLPDCKGMTPVMLCSAEGHEDVLQLLLDHNAGINKAGSNGQTALHLAVANNHMHVVEKLFTVNARVDACDESNRTPLMVAAHNGSSRLVSFLLSKNADPVRQERKGWTPLMLCSQYGYTGCMELLLKAASDAAILNMRCSLKNTALSISAANGHKDAVELLLETKNVDLDVQNHDGLTPVMLSTRNGHLSVVRSLLKNVPKLDLNYEDIQEGNTALHIAAEKGHTQIACILIQNGAKVNARNLSFKTALHICASKGRVQILRKLLQYRANAKLVDGSGNTPLSLSAEAGHEQIVEILLQKGRFNNDEISNAKEAARLRGRTSVTEKISAYQSNPVEDTTDDTPNDALEDATDVEPSDHQQGYEVAVIGASSETLSVSRSVKISEASKSGDVNVIHSSLAFLKQDTAHHERMSATIRPLPATKDLDRTSVDLSSMMTQSFSAQNLTNVFHIHQGQPSRPRKDATKPRRPLTQSQENPSNRVLNKIANELGHTWKILGRALGLSDGNLDHLESDNALNALERNYQMLRKWRTENGSEATMTELAKCLEEIGCGDLADMLHYDNASEIVLD